MEWQKVLEILTCKSKSTFLLQKNIKQENEIMIHLWNDQNIKKLIYLWLEDHYNKKEFKSITKAQSFKIIGNKEFQAKNYMKSVESYTKCALYAPMNSCELPIAIANRSASLFYLNRYDDCIKDIELSIKLNYPKQLHYKLYLRAIQCYLKLGKHHLAKETLSKIQQLIHDPNYIKPSMRDNIEKKICNITFIESCVQDIVTCHHHHNTNDILKLKSQIIFEENTNFPNASITIDRIHNEKLGRHVVANKFIKEGDILFLEEPISFVLLNHDTYSFCQYCNNLNTDIPVPCRTCLNTFYCNENCLTKAWSLYHCWECPGNQMNLWKEIGIGHLALKVLLTCSTITDKIKFNEMQNLVTNFDKLSMDDLTIYGITAIMLTIYLFKYTNFFKINNFENSLMKKFLDNFFNLNFNILTNNDKQLYISSLLLRYILQLISNGHAITKSNIFLSKNDSSMIQQDIVATGIYPSASIMNHSCDPNIINIFVNQYLIVRASRDISQGPHYRHMTTENRQKILKSQYCFICKCKACTLPKLQYFVERFNAMKCLKCNGALCNIKNSTYCLDCDDKSQIPLLNKIIQANEIFQISEVYINLGKPEKALDKLEKCLHIRRTVLYKYNEDITITLNLMAEIYKIMGQWINSIMCLENTLAAIKEKFGSFSIELLNQLNNLTDMCFKYLEKELNTKNTNTHKKIIKKTQIFLNQIEEITNLNYGFWSNIYKDVKKKQNQFLNYSTYNLNK
ncbi:SET and MYND domain-containing protein 4-like isoform X2 [Apis laboriosa]|uniref:SET and MYND domain-containing protein 4-like isoform X2 n=1 Tax=Apis laboriosa TaxID=183418 RepID=UPI001CC74CF3|nr:SET and MYND domain-containing protein 4-like isoform X2 [Apis laboriosa]